MYARDTPYISLHGRPERRTVNARRTMSLAARVVFGTAWAACLVLLGLVLLIEPPSGLLHPRVPIAIVGLSAIAAGLFLFMTIVADRLVPTVGRRQSMFELEMVMASIFAVCWVTIGVLLLVFGRHTA